MIKALPDWLESGANIRKIHHPSGGITHISFNGNLDLKRVAVKTGTLMILRYVGEAMGSLKTEFFEYFHINYLNY